jgi:peptidoglycan hydrolase-like protein with peptidoglycan-binding domain
MNKITFPLSTNMKHETVADLHAALKVLKFDVPEAEAQENFYGEETAAAVRRFQAKHELRKTGRVDETTAHMLNHLLHKSGYLDENDSYLVRGIVDDKSSNKPVAGLLVRAVDMDPSGENPLGGPVITDDEGYYSIVYYDHQFRIAGHESGNADIVVRVYDPKNSERPLKQSKMPPGSHGQSDPGLPAILTATISGW